MARKKPVGWRKEPVRHGLAAKGIKTGEKPHVAEVREAMSFSLKESFPPGEKEILSMWRELDLDTAEEVFIQAYGWDYGDDQIEAVDLMDKDIQHLGATPIWDAMKDRGLA